VPFQVTVPDDPTVGATRSRLGARVLSDSAFTSAFVSRIRRALVPRFWAPVLRSGRT